MKLKGFIVIDRSQMVCGPIKKERPPALVKLKAILVYYQLYRSRNFSFSPFFVQFIITTFISRSAFKLDGEIHSFSTSPSSRITYDCCPSKDQSELRGTPFYPSQMED